MEKMSLKKSGIIFENPYQDASSNVCLELLQLLLVVEKIKASKVGMNTLESLVSLHDFLRDQDRIRGYFTQIGAMSITPEADEIFSTVCRVLDTKQKPSFNDFSIAANSYLKQFRDTSNLQREMLYWERQAEFWFTIAPELINEHGYDFKSLQNDALGYSHLSIVYAYKEATHILKVIEDLQNINDNKIVEEAIKQCANEIKVERSSVLKKSERSLHFRHQINQKICRCFSNDFFQRVNSVKRLFAIDSTPNKIYSPDIKVKKEEYKSILYKPEVCDVVTMKLPREAFNHAKDSGTEILLNRDILTCIWAAVNEQSSFQNYVDESYHLHNLSEYSYWANNQNETLLSIELNKGRKLSISTIMRGLKFSYWFYSEKAKQQKRLNIGEAVELYAKEVKEKELKEVNPTTVKLSFEAIKRVAKTELSSLICKQLFWRLNNDIPSVRYSFCPLNDSFYQKLKHVVSEIKSILNLQVDIDNYSSLLEKIVQIEELLKDDDGAEYRDTEWWSVDISGNNMDRQRLKELVEYREVLFILKP